MKRVVSNTLLLATLFSVSAACGSDPAVLPTLEVDVFGWNDDEGFVTGLPAFDDAQTARVKVTQPLDRAVVASETFVVGERSGDLVEVPFGENLRMDFEVLDSQGVTIASGATPLFDFEPDRQLRTFRLQVTEVNAFAPVGNLVVDRNTNERKFAWSKFDYRGKDVSWLGRVGHATAPTSDGRVLVVGGGDPVPGAGPGRIPEFRSIYGDIQLFDPETGYFTDLAFDESTGALLPEGQDRLFEPIVFHTVTPIGDDRFLVTGGFTPRSDVMRPVNTIQIIDLGAPKGTRVQRLVDGDGSSLVLQKARGWHTATYRSVDKHVVIAGGVGPQGESDVLATFEMVDLATNAIYQQPFPLQEARAEHEAVLMADGRTVWLLGGRGESEVLDSTEIVRLSDGGTTESESESSMKTARFGFGATRLTPGGNQLVLVAGGFTDFEGGTDDTFEISKPGRGLFDTGTDWKLTTGRGAPNVVELPQSHDVVVIGGRDSSGEILGSADRLTFVDLETLPPYEVESIGDSQTPRLRPSADLLSTGNIVLIGGEGELPEGEAGLDSADLFNPLDPVGGSSTVVVVEE